MTNQQFVDTSSADFQGEVEKFRQSDDDLIYESSSRDSKLAAPVTNAFSNQHQQSTHEYKFVPLTMGGNGRTHEASEESRRLIEQEVSLADLETMTSLFYERVFQDPTLDQFIRSRNDPHGSRFAKWIHQKLSDSTVWDEDRRTRNLKPVIYPNGFRHVVHDRSSAHAAAWFSPMRPSEAVGRRFQLDECRVWMRLHFWALRDSGILERSPSFADYYVRFIGHFVNVYESSAPKFARDSWRWSGNKANIEAYLTNGRRMNDVLGLTLAKAMAQLPRVEQKDNVWPYNTSKPAE